MCFVWISEQTAIISLYLQSRIAKTRGEFNKKTLFTSKLDLNLRKKLVKCYTWSIALYGAGTWTLRKLDQKYLESFEMCAGEEQLGR
jgi:hypothetical protein